MRNSMRFLAGMAVLCVSALSASGAQTQPMRELYVRAHRFPVSIASDRTDVLASGRVEMFVSKSPADGWMVDGTCMLVSMPDGLEYQREATVPYDGIFFFRLGMLDASGNHMPPPDNAPAQLKVIVDTVAPVLEIATPEEGTHFGPKEAIHISWKTSDPNLSPRPICVAYALGGDKARNFIVQDIENSGTITWTSPDVPNTATQIIVLAKDLAGNVAVAERNIIIGATGGTLEPETGYTPTKPGLIAFTMAGNLVRQQRPKDALRYYHMALEHDPNFADAMNDAALVYASLEEYDKSLSLMRRALDRRPQDPYLYQNLGDVEQKWGMFYLRLHDMDNGLAHIKEALKHYGHAIELSEQQKTMAERGGAYFRLGEISYYVNGDLTGARQYWRKVIDLYAPTPDITEPTPVYYRHTTMQTELRTWQMWAREHLRILDQYEAETVGTYAVPAARFEPHASTAATGSIADPKPATNRQMYRSTTLPEPELESAIDKTAERPQDVPPPSPRRSRSFLPWR